MKHMRYIGSRVVWSMALIATAFGVIAVAAEKESELAPPFALNLMSAVRGETEYRIAMEEGRSAVLTLQPRLQVFAQTLFSKYKVPAGAAMMIDAKNGKILALAQHRSSPDHADTDMVAFDPSPPAASLFKIVTASALIEQTPVSPKTETCYKGGSQRIEMTHLVDDVPREEGSCASLSAALGRSLNAVFAKLSDRYLKGSTLLAYAEKFGFNRDLPFDVAMTIGRSTAEIPEERLERARASAGFWHSYLSVFHASVIALSLAQGGVMMSPCLVERIEAADKRVLYRAEAHSVGRIVKRETAAHLMEAMTQTIKVGSSQKVFYDRSGVPVLGDIEVAGKTGTLYGKKPFRAYTWFIGIAPANRPEVVVATLVVNNLDWRINGPGVAAQLLKKYFEQQKKRKRDLSSRPHPVSAQVPARSANE